MDKDERTWLLLSIRVYPCASVAKTRLAQRQLQEVIRTRAPSSSTGITFDWSGVRQNFTSS